MNHSDLRVLRILRPGLLLAGVLALAGCSLAPDTGASGTETAAKSALPASTIASNLAIAKADRMKGDYAASLKILGQLLLASPDDGRIVSEYGKVLAQQGRATEALPFLTRAQTLRPDDWTVASALGVAQDQAGHFDKAAAAYEQALSLHPDAPEVLNNYALSRLMAGDAAQAKILIARAAHASNDPKIQANQAMIIAYAKDQPATDVTAAPPKPAPAPAKIARSTLPPPQLKPSASKDEPRKTAQNKPKAKKQAQPKGEIPALRLAADVQ